MQTMTPDLIPTSPNEEWLRTVGIFDDEWRNVARLVVHHDEAVTMLQSLHDYPGQLAFDVAVGGPQYSAYDSDLAVFRLELLSSLTELGLVSWDEFDDVPSVPRPDGTTTKVTVRCASTTPKGASWLQAQENQR